MNKQRKTSHILNVFQYDETTGAVTLPSSLSLATPDSTDNSTKVATTAWIRAYVGSLSYATASSVTTAIANLVASAPTTLDTLNELATALGNDPNFATTITTSIGNKLSLTGGTLTGDLTLSGTNPRLYFTDTDNNPDYFISNTDGTFTVYDVTNSVGRFKIYTTGNAEFSNNLTALSFVKTGGTAAQFLKADGSVDSSAYLTGITSGQVTTALGYTPVPTTRTITINGTAYNLSADVSWTIASGVTAFNTRTGAITLTSGDVTGALGFTPYNATNPSGYISGITSLMVTNALGFTPYNATNPAGYITSSGSITGSAMSLNGYANQTEYTILNGPANGPVWKVRYDSATANRYIDLGFKDGNGTYYEGFKIYNNGTPTWVGNTILHAGNWNSYAPGLTGGGASGTWGINVTGSAGSVAWTNVSGRPTTVSSFTNDSGYLTSALPYGNWGGNTGMNDYRLYLRTSGDTNHYLWNAADDWEELGAYAGTGFRVTSSNGATGLLYVYGGSNGGYTYSPYSFRAPIFYDSDDTGYYVDPNGVSRLYRLQVIGDWAGSSPNQGAINIRGQYPSMTFRNTVSGNMWLRHMDGSGHIQHYFAPSGVDASDWSIKHTMYTNGDFYSSGNHTATYVYASGSIRLGDMWNSTGGLYRPSGIMCFGTENEGWRFSMANSQKAYIGTDGNLWMAWSGEYLSTTLGRKAVHRGEGENYVDYSRYVYNNGAYSGSGWIEPSDLGVRYAYRAELAYSADRVYPFGSAIDSAEAGYGMRVWYDWAYSGTYRNGITIGSNPGDQAYGFQLWQNMWDDRTYTRRKNGGWQSTRTLMNLQDDYYAANMNQYVRTSDSPTFSAVYASNHFRAYGDSGLFSQDYGGYFRRNTNSYGTWESVGYAKNGWGGYVNNNNYIVSWMLNTSGDFGFLTQNGNWWNLFYNNGNNCWGIGTDNTYSGDGFRCIKYGSSQYGWTTWSDRRAKENISTITGALDKVLNMRGVYFNYISDEAKNKRVGFIAQELEQVLPEAVRYAEEIDEYNVEYAQIVSVLAEAIKEQNVKITRLESLVEQLTNN